MFKKSLLSLLVLSFFLVSLEARQKDVYEKEQAENLRYNKAIRAFMKESKALEQLVYKSHVYIAFPSIGKGGLVLGGAYGEGRAYRRGMWIGDVSMSQYTIGLQVGGQSYKEIIFFLTPESFENFKKTGLLSSTQASLVGYKAGVSGDTNIDDDVLVYTSSNGGLMLEASTGAQKFTYTSRE